MVVQDRALKLYSAYRAYKIVLTSKGKTQRKQVACLLATSANTRQE